MVDTRSFRMAAIGRLGAYGFDLAYKLAELENECNRLGIDFLSLRTRATDMAKTTRYTVLQSYRIVIDEEKDRINRRGL